MDGMAMQVAGAWKTTDMLPECYQKEIRTPCRFSLAVLAQWSKPGIHNLREIFPAYVGFLLYDRKQHNEHSDLDHHHGPIHEDPPF